MGGEENEILLLDDALAQNGNGEQYTGDGSVDIHGKPVLTRKTGDWRACRFILGTACFKDLAYYGIATNLVSYLTSKLREGNVSAATIVNTWIGTCNLTPLIGAVLADSHWGRYWTIATFSIFYFIGMCTLTLSASVPAFKPDECMGSNCPSATPVQYGIFFSGLYLIAFGFGGLQPCLPSFGADQFDDTNPIECINKGSFFNWFYLSMSIGAFISSTLIVWIEENVGWGIGFGFCTLIMGTAIAIFFPGTPLYRFQRCGGSPLTRMCQVVVASCHNRKLDPPEDSSLLYETADELAASEGCRKLEHTKELMFLDKAAVLPDEDKKAGNFSNSWRLCTVTQVEELKILIRMFPIWASGIVFAALYSQVTMFVVQGAVMERTVGSLAIPPASLTAVDVISVIFWVPIYDRILVPIARKITGKERGFSDLQRIGIGLFLSILCIIAAALVEARRLKLARELGLVDRNVAAPLGIFWQVPQYFLLGATEVFTCVGQMEFFYEQAPDTMRSFCGALCLLTTSLGSYLSSLILTIVTTITTSGGKPGWIPDNLNKGRLDNFFWLIAGLSFLNLLVYVYFAVRFKPKKAV